MTDFWGTIQMILVAMAFSVGIVLVTIGTMMLAIWAFS